MIKKFVLFLTVVMNAVISNEAVAVEQPAYRPFEKAVYSQRFYTDDQIVYRRPHTVILQCRTNATEKENLIMEIKRPLFPDAKADLEATARFSSTELPYTSRGIALEKAKALTFDSLSIDRAFPVFPSTDIKMGDKWIIKAPPILYDWDNFDAVKDGYCDVRHKWLRTKNKYGYLCAELEISIDDDYIDPHSGTRWAMSVKGKVFFSLQIGLPVWEQFKVRMTSLRQGKKERVKTGKRMSFLIDYEGSSVPSRD